MSHFAVVDRSLHRLVFTGTIIAYIPLARLTAISS
jgi:hypothetical protein